MSSFKGSSPKRRPIDPRERERREQTKFDKWLVKAKEGGIRLHMVTDDSAPYDTTDYLVLVIEVDRYMVCLKLLEFANEEDPAVWWIPKDSIKAMAYQVPARGVGEVRQFPPSRGRD